VVTVLSNTDGGGGEYEIYVDTTDAFGHPAPTTHYTIWVGGNSQGGEKDFSAYNHAVIAFGVNGGETLTGSSHNDAISGAKGEDILIGGAGGDTLLGGADTDTFKYTAVTDSQSGMTGAYSNFDTIRDFAPNTDTTLSGGIHTSLNGDLISLNSIDANLSLGADQAFTFDLVQNSSAVAGHVTWNQVDNAGIDNDYTVVQAAVVGGGIIEVHLAGLVNLTQHAFDL
jgi:Ca2+-binding RTX toxin-like protein